ncbi:Potassium Voltage-Gated Channel Subfamily A Member 6 [Manis pentadactyla]|nr:Potassium Voltage-Gated Channel Subfamily A Member 6 [Manis pentadactyla]
MSWPSTADGGCNQSAPSLRLTVTGLAAGSERRCRLLPHRRWGFPFVPRLHLRLRGTSWCCAISKIPRKGLRREGEAGRAGTRNHWLNQANLVKLWEEHILFVLWHG